MPIDFTTDRWDRARENYRKWWANELDRPLIHVTLDGFEPGRPKPNLPDPRFLAFHDFSVTAEQVIDVLDYRLSSRKYLGDGFPHVWLDFGAGINAAFMGAELCAAPEAGTVWFKPKTEQEIRDIHFEYDADNRWLKRVKDLARAAGERWQGQVQVGMTDLGGILDIISTFRPGDKLLLDLYDHPDDVKRLIWETQELWFRYFDEISAVCNAHNPGYTAWTPIFSETPYYMLQCDFCYMIGPDMFDEFVKPELETSCRRLANPFYHLDGPGQLAHLNSLLGINQLKGVQWVPGAGQPHCSQWPEVYRKIRKSGKLVHLFQDKPDALDKVSGQMGGAKGVVIFINARRNDEGRIRELLARYGVDPSGH